MHLLQLLLFTIVNGAAGFFQGVVGFGQGLVATPVSLTFLDKNTVLGAMILAGVILNSFLSRQITEPLNKSIFRPLLIGSVLGMPIGVVILKLLPLNTLRVTVGVLSIVLTLAILFVRLRTHHLRRLAPLAGFVSGILQTSTSLSGPPVVLLLTGAGIAKNEMRKLLVLYFLCISLVSLPLYLVSGVLTWRGIAYGLVASPVIIATGYLGNKVARHVPHKWYRVIALVTVCATGAVAIYSGLHH